MDFGMKYKIFGKLIETLELLYKNLDVVLCVIELSYLQRFLLIKNKILLLINLRSLFWSRNIGL